MRGGAVSVRSHFSLHPDLHHDGDWDCGGRERTGTAHHLGGRKVMHKRLPAGEIIQGSKTTSAKIRALTRGGYLRTEISRLLGVRYQHVRKVLVDAGITDGLQRQVEAEREPVVVDSAPQAREAVSCEVLLQSSFRLVGSWASDADSAIRLDGAAPIEPGVYAFVVDDNVAYVGLTNDGLRKRLDQYRYGYEGQRTNARVKSLITKSLSDGKKVTVLVATPEALEWNGLPVNTAAGLEAAIIEMISPPWNILGRARSKD
jgi:hypothetical protein